MPKLATMQSTNGAVVKKIRKQSALKPNSIDRTAVEKMPNTKPVTPAGAQIDLIRSSFDKRQSATPFEANNNNLQNFNDNFKGSTKTVSGKGKSSNSNSWKLQGA